MPTSTSVVEQRASLPPPSTGTKQAHPRHRFAVMQQVRSPSVEEIFTEVIKNDGQRCFAMTGAYERELRDVLSGTEKGVNAVIRSCTPEEKERMKRVQHRPFLVVRAAGSGMEGSGDLVALRGDCCFPIEVKTTRAAKLYFSGRTKDQLHAMIREGERSGLMPLYAHRRKGVRGDSWRIFRVQTKGLTGTLRKLSPLIPPLQFGKYIHNRSLFQRVRCGHFIGALLQAHESAGCFIQGVTHHAKKAIQRHALFPIDEW